MDQRMVLAGASFTTILTLTNLVVMINEAIIADMFGGD